MKYLGGKSKIAKKLTDIILAHTSKRGTLIEPFLGGGAMAASLAPNFKEVLAFDTNHDLILMWNALKEGWIPPSQITEDQYRQLRDGPPSPLRSFAAFGSSWGAKWFGGYARGKDVRGNERNYADESARSLLRDIKNMGNCFFECADYRELKILSGDVVYCDPPYAGTTEYKDSFDSTYFWETAKGWSLSGASVFVSEYKAPEDWCSIWEVERTRDLKSRFTNAVKVTEKLYVFRG